MTPVFRHNIAGLPSLLQNATLLQSKRTSETEGLEP